MRTLVKRSELGNQDFTIEKEITYKKFNYHHLLTVDFIHTPFCYGIYYWFGYNTNNVKNFDCTKIKKDKN